MKSTHTIIVGGGQAGLAMSRCLSDRGVDHVVLERGRVAERWRTERWDSLRLLTPNWQTRLPGFAYEGPEPDGYMTMPEVVSFFERYAGVIDAPVEPATTVQSVEAPGPGFRVTTDRGTWRAEAVVIATGHCDVPMIPPAGARLGPHVVQVVPSRYRNPHQLPEGGVLVVGASASGIQLADEIHRSGRPVTLSVGRHVRMPRVYRGRDIMWWLDNVGILDEPVADAAARRHSSLQLIGHPDRITLDLPTLERRGVRLVGRVGDVAGDTVFFEDNLVSDTVAADVRIAVLRSRIDEFIVRTGLASQVPDPEPFVPFVWPAPPPPSLRLESAGIRTVLWATGFRRSYPWLKIPVLDERGDVRHRGGIVEWPGLYVLGLQFLRRRKSSFIDGVGKDAFELAEHLARHCQAQVA